MAGALNVKDVEKLFLEIIKKKLLQEDNK